MTIRATVAADDTISSTVPGASTIKAAAINSSTEFTRVSATVLPTVVKGFADIAAVSLDSTSYIRINGVISGIRVEDNDAGPSPQSDDPADSRLVAIAENTMISL